MQHKAIKDLTLGVVGVGMVGGAMADYFEKEGRNLKLYDPGKELGSMEEVNEADIVFVCVPTPYDKEKGGFDLSYVEETCQNLEGGSPSPEASAKQGKIVVIKSTVVPGTTEYLQGKYPSHRFLFNPEFLTEHTAEQDMRYPDRQIVGYTEKSYSVAGDVTRVLPLAPYETVMPATEAETVKYYGNTWLAVKVTFANQMYDLCEKLGIDYERVMEAAAADKRVGRSHLQVFHKGYRGYGGKCLNKDIRALIQFAEKQGVSLDLHKRAEEINNRMMEEQGIEHPETFSKRKGY